MPNPLQHSEDFDDRGAPLVERFANTTFLVVERLQARLRRLDAGLDIAHARRGVDELLIERAPIVAKRVDLAPSFAWLSADSRSLRARGIEFLIVLLESVGIGLSVGTLGADAAGGTGAWADGRLNRACRGFGRWRLRECGQIGAERQRQSQSRTEHKARIGAARSAENHVVQG